jgi:hypothetical protein
MVEASYRVKECTKRLRRKLRRRPTNEEIAVDTGIPIKRVEAAVNLPKYSVSLDSKIGSTDMTYQVWTILCLYLILWFLFTHRAESSGSTRLRFSGGHSWSQCWDSWRDAQQNVHEEGRTHGTRYSHHSREASCCSEVWARGWSDKNPAGDR